MSEDERWKFEKVGMGYRCWDDEIQTEFRLTHLKRSRGDLTGELSVSTNLKGTKTHRGVLHVARFNVLSSSSRSTLAKTLEKRTPGQDLDWWDGLEWLCQNVILAETSGEPISAVGLSAPTPPDQRWMVEPLIMRDRPALLFGPGGVGKSLLALTCGLSVAAGREIIPGVPPAMKGPVLYLDWETTHEVINDRIVAICSGHGFKAPEGMYYRRCVRPLADDAEALSAIVAEKKITLVIVDSAAYAMGSMGEYGDANESVLRMHEALRLIGVTSQIVDHVNKTEARQKGGTATPYGSAYKTWAARISWEVRKAPSADGLAINLYHAKSNDTATLEPIGISLDWTNDAITFRSMAVVEDDEQEARTESATDMVRELLSDGEEMDVANIVKTLRSGTVKDNTIRQAVSRLEKRGVLTKTDRGGYMLSRPPIKIRSLPGRGMFDA